jgi:hypothetical protein
VPGSAGRAGAPPSPSLASANSGEEEAGTREEEVGGGHNGVGREEEVASGRRSDADCGELGVGR